MKTTAEKIINIDFLREVDQGLSSKTKYLSSKYFYDDKGSQIFRNIMRMPEYYLTDSEFSILRNSKKELLNFIRQHSTSTFDLVELGAGDGLKTKILLSHFLEEGVSFEYMPIDISADAMRLLITDLHQDFPKLVVHPQVGTYQTGLHKIAALNNDTNVLLFMGSNIGNFDLKESIVFIQELMGHINPGDLLIVGFDLQKDPDIIHQAYSDPAGLTRDFNLNLLTRINHELGGNFKLTQFKHYESYNPLSGKAESFLVSKEAQQVRINILDKTYNFEAWETIHTEISQKFSESMINDIAQQAKLERLTSFYDERNYFVDVVFRKPL